VPPTEPADRALAEAIRRIREERGLTQEDAAHAAGLTVGSFARIERGRSTPAWTTVKRVAAALGLTAAELAREAER
jgi:transcriptional regulator with XRE-family HTH domain